MSAIPYMSLTAYRFSNLVTVFQGFEHFENLLKSTDIPSVEEAEA